LLSLATFQLQGVGRNYKPWLSPHGVLQWSLLLELPPKLEHLNRNTDLFTQLLGLTVVETCRRRFLGSAAPRLALKWPNDIYASVNDQREKIGGIVVNYIPATLSGPRNRILIGERTPLSKYPRLMPQQDVVSTFATMDLYTHCRDLLM
jgi:biotin-(acetyl-CoA carboxylase) ligase